MSVITDEFVQSISVNIFTHSVTGELEGMPFLSEVLWFSLDRQLSTTQAHPHFPLVAWVRESER